MNHANLVIQTFDEAQLDPDAGCVIFRGTIPELFEQSGKLLEGPDPIH